MTKPDQKIVDTLAEKFKGRNFDFCFYASNDEPNKESFQYGMGCGLEDTLDYIYERFEMWEHGQEPYLPFDEYRGGEIGFILQDDEGCNDWTYESEIDELFLQIPK